jgi:sugar phosphate permease
VKIFYGWRVVGAGLGLQFLYAGLFMQAFGAYVAVLSEERGWSKTTLSGAAALQSVEGALLGPAMGWLVDRFGARALVHIGVVLMGLGFLALSQIDSVGGFYGAIVLIALGTTCAGYFPLTITVMHWFQRLRARALSLMGLGLALGGLAVPAVGWMMQTYGWRHAAIASGILMLAVGLPLARMIRRHPSEVGEQLDGGPVVPLTASTTPSSTPDAPQAPVPAQRQFTAHEALRTQAFWYLALGHGLALLTVTAVNVHAISHMKEGLGYTLAQASLVIMLMTLAQIGGLLLGALVGDRWDKRYIAAACMLAHMAGLLMLTYAVHPAMLGAFAVLHGMAWGLRGPFMQAMRADYFGLQAIGMIMGLSAFVIAIGQVLGPMVAGMFADAMGNYRMGFTLLALVAGSGSLLFLLAKKPD